MSWAEFIDYIFKGVVLSGGAYLFYFMRNTYDREIANYKVQIDVLKETQVEKYVERMNKFKEFYESTIKEREKEIDKLKQEMDKLLKDHLSKEEVIQYQKKLIDDFENNVINYELNSWDKFVDDSKRILKVVYAEKWEDIINKDTEGILWTIKFKNHKVMERFKHPISRKDEEDT